jgi:hypothetical protein
MAKTRKLSNLPNAPAWIAYRATSDQSVTSATWTKFQANTESLDTASAFDSSTNYRYTATTAGYYQINGTVYVSAASGLTAVGAKLYKNGLPAITGTLCAPLSATEGCATISALVYLNGTTDYIELWGYGTGTTVVFKAGADLSHFSGTMVRPA